MVREGKNNIDYGIVEVYVAVHKKTCHTINFIVEEGLVKSCNEIEFIGRPIDQLALKEYELTEIK